MTKKAILLAAVILISVKTIQAEVPQLINYQGVLSDAESNPVTAQNLSIIFKIYDSETGGALLWFETQTVNVSEGLFNVLLGSVKPIPYEVFDGSKRYLSIKVGADTEMLPRKHLVSVGNAFHAHTADGVAGGNYVEKINGVQPNASGDFAIVAGDNVSVGAISNGIKISASAGGEGFSLPYHKGMDYEGAYMFSLSNNNGNFDSGVIRVESEGGYAYQWYSGGSYGHIKNSGVFARYSSDGPYCKIASHYYGLNSWTTYSGTRKTDAYLASDDYGVCGYYIDGYNKGYLGTENYGVYAIGGYGSSMSNKNAVNSVGNSLEPSYAVYGEHEGGNYGYIGGETYSVYGQNGNYSGYLGGSSYGVCGRVGSKCGYLGHNNKAGYFVGNVDIDGYLNVTGRKNFKIDHPLDPENKYLYHYCVESDEWTNVYSGNATLDSEGNAVVDLPEWFEALNTDFRYQLTCIGGFARVYVAEEIDRNQFKIAGGQPAMKVSWQVTGIRNDPYAKANPVQPEQEKSGAEVGFYLHPKAYGATEAMGISGREQIKLRQEYENINNERKMLSEKQRQLEEREAQRHEEMEKEMEAEKQQMESSRKRQSK